MIDYTALLGLAAGIQVAKADYDFARDGGAQYQKKCNSEIIPSGSILLGCAVYTTAAITFATAGQLTFQLADVSLATASPTLGNIGAQLYNAAAAIVTNADRPIDATIVSSAITAGAATIWVFYLPI
jgi:hypothetical protein